MKIASLTKIWSMSLIALIVFTLVTPFKVYGVEVSTSTENVVPIMAPEPGSQENEEVFVLKYEEVVLYGETKFLITLNTEEHIVADKVSRENNQVTYEIDGEKSTVPFLTKDTATLIEKIDEYSSFYKIYEVSLPIIVVLFILFMLTLALDKFVRSFGELFMYIGMLAGYLMVFMIVVNLGYSAKAYAVNREITIEAVSIYEQNYNGELPIMKEKSPIVAEFVTLYEVDKEKISEIEPQLINVRFDKFLIEETTGTVYKRKGLEE